MPLHSLYLVYQNVSAIISFTIESVVLRMSRQEMDSIVLRESVVHEDGLSKLHRNSFTQTWIVLSSQHFVGYKRAKYYGIYPDHQEVSEVIILIPLLYCVVQVLEVIANQGLMKEPSRLSPTKLRKMVSIWKQDRGDVQTDTDDIIPSFASETLSEPQEEDSVDQRCFFLTRNTKNQSHE